MYCKGLPLQIPLLPLSFHHAPAAVVGAEAEGANAPRLWYRPPIRGLRALLGVPVWPLPSSPGCVPGSAVAPGRSRVKVTFRSADFSPPQTPTHLDAVQLCCWPDALAYQEGVHELEKMFGAIGGPPI